MLKNRIIPCLDVKNGRVVKGINFVDLKDAGDPVEQAKIYSDGGADEICFLDITASNENRETIYNVVERTSKKCFVPLTVGGGVRNVEDINKLLKCGADKVSINTAAVENSKVVIDSSKKFGSQCIVVAIDAKKNDDKWEVFTHGGRNNSGIDALEYAKKMEDNGAGELLVTSMDRDGTQIGYDIDLMNKISSKVNIPLIASGGLSDEEIEKMVKDAEANKDADKKKRESVDVRNQADTLIHSTEKNLKEHGSKISDAEKKAIEDGSNTLKESLKGEDIEDIKKKTETLVQASMKLGEAIYKSQQNTKPKSSKDDGKDEKEKKDDNVVDADFEEVKDENKEKSA